MSESLLITVKEAAKLIGLPWRTLYQLAKMPGGLPDGMVYKFKDLRSVYILRSKVFEVWPALNGAATSGKAAHSLEKHSGRADGPRSPSGLKSHALKKRDRKSARVR